MLRWKYLCNKHFCESDFTTAEKIHRNRVAVPCVSDSKHNLEALGLNRFKVSLIQEVDVNALLTE
jgi:hypothetical protein